MYTKIPTPKNMTVKISPIIGNRGQRRPFSIELVHDLGKKEMEMCKFYIQKSQCELPYYICF